MGDDPNTGTRTSPRASDDGQQGGEWLGHPVKADRLSQQAGVAELAHIARAEEAPQLRRLVLSPPCGLPLECSERAEVPVRGEDLRHQGRSGGADEFVLQVLDADEKAQSLKVGARPGCPEAGRGQALL